MASSSLIDLTSSRSGSPLAGPIDLTSSRSASPIEVEEEVPASHGKRKAVSVKPEHIPHGKRRISSLPLDRSEVTEDEDDDELQEVAAVAPMVVDAPTTHAHDQATGAEDTDDVVFVGRTGDLALSDFPHCRENCVNHKFVPGREAESCSNCFCYVCDAPVRDCPQWSGDHCMATHKEQRWQNERQRWRTKGAAGAVGSKQPVGQSVVLAPRVERWSCDKMLAAIQQVFPLEEPEPSGFPAGVMLKPYQRQSLAFMLDVERSTDPTLLGGTGFRGGWLCDEVGMGKTAVVVALILANAAPAPSPKEPFRKKLTIYVVNNTLVQQVADEFRKFSPELQVCMYYGSAKNKQKAMGNIDAVDVLVTTPHKIHEAELPRQPHRLIVDESHLLESGSTSSKLPSLQQYSPRYTWLVTGTPFSTSLGQLAKQATLLGQWSDGVRVQEVVYGKLKPGQTNYYNGSRRWRGLSTHNRDQLSNDEIATRLRRVMIRHTKSMRIGGEVALALPDADCETIWLDMSPNERLLYQILGCTDGEQGAPTSQKLTQGVDHRMRACAHAYDAQVVCGNRGYRQNPHEVGVSALERKYSLESPSPIGIYAQATAAFLDVTEKVMVKAGKPPPHERYDEQRKKRSAKLAGKEYEQPAKTIEGHVAKITATKFAALFADLKELHTLEPHMRCVIFTEQDRTQENLVRLALNATRAGGSLQGLAVFEFNQDTPPLKRHKLIKDFQDGKRPGIFIVTYGTAAVGITLTAASRVYLMEPALDPATEAQAAGRIHRLGQTREVLIKRFCFRDSVEEAVCELHSKIKSGEIVVVDGKFPREAADIFLAHGVAQPHDHSGPISVVNKIGVYDKHYGFRCSEQACIHCGKPKRIPGSTTFWGGKALHSYQKSYTCLNGSTDDKYHSEVSSMTYVREQDLDQLPAGLPWRSEVVAIDPGAIKSKAERKLVDMMKEVRTFIKQLDPTEANKHGYDPMGSLKRSIGALRSMCKTLGEETRDGRRVDEKLMCEATELSRNALDPTVLKREYEEDLRHNTALVTEQLEAAIGWRPLRDGERASNPRMTGGKYQLRDKTSAFAALVKRCEEEDYEQHKVDPALLEIARSKLAEAQKQVDIDHKQDAEGVLTKATAEAERAFDAAVKPPSSSGKPSSSSGTAHVPELRDISTDVLLRRVCELENAVKDSEAEQDGGRRVADALLDRARSILSTHEQLIDNVYKKEAECGLRTDMDRVDQLTANRSNLYSLEMAISALNGKISAAVDTGEQKSARAAAPELLAQANKKADESIEVLRKRRAEKAEAAAAESD